MERVRETREGNGICGLQRQNGVTIEGSKGPKDGGIHEREVGKGI